VLAHRGQKILQIGTIPGFLTLYCLSIFLKIFKNENLTMMKNIPDPPLLQTSFLSSEIKKGTKIS
jgi:hypothetical protein